MRGGGATRARGRASNVFLLAGLAVAALTIPVGDPIRGWLTCPAGAADPLPTIVEFVGYGGGRGLPEEHLQWATAGYAHLLMDTRGKGSEWGHGGDTATAGHLGCAASRMSLAHASGRS